MKKALEWLKSVVGEKIVMLLISKLLTKDNIIKVADGILDVIENYTAGTDYKWDDKAVKAVRDALQIPDNDTPKEG